MKIAMVILAVLGFALDVYAIVVRSIQGYKSERKVISDGGVVEYKAKRVAEMQAQTRAIEKAKEISMDKLEFPKGAKHCGLFIDRLSRIDSLCGYEIGSIVKILRRPHFDKDGNIVITQKLKTPFRKCTQVELKYSKVNHALYSIRVFAPAQKNMTDEVALAEVEAMCSALKAKFGEKICGFTKLNLTFQKSHHANMHFGSFQDLKILGYKDNIEKRGVLKGPVDARKEIGWAFSVTLTDRAMWNFVLEASKPKPSNDVSQKDVDAL